jgi:hypothetical protein
MKVKTDDSGDDFKPFTLSITFETLQEARDFQALFIASKLDPLMKNIEDAAIWTAMDSACPAIGDNNAACQAVNNYVRPELS